MECNEQKVIVLECENVLGAWAKWASSHDDRNMISRDILLRRLVIPQRWCWLEVLSHMIPTWLSGIALLELILAELAID